MDILQARNMISDGKEYWAKTLVNMGYSNQTLMIIKQNSKNKV